LQYGRMQSYVRPLCAAPMAAGPDDIRGVPNSGGLKCVFPAGLFFNQRRASQQGLHPPRHEAAPVDGPSYQTMGARHQTNPVSPSILPAKNAKAGVLHAEIARVGLEIKHRNGQ
jgi:hypothetical protein